MTAYHAKYFAHDITRQAPHGVVDQLSMSLFDAFVDLNPHQIEAALFALQWAVNKADMTARHILFQDEDKDTYIESLLSAALSIESAA